MSAPDRIGQVFVLPAVCLVLESLPPNLTGDPLWRILFLDTERTTRLTESYLAEREICGDRIA